MGPPLAVTPTPRLQALASAAAALYLAAFLAASVPTAVAATALLAYLLHTRHAATASVAAFHPRIRREASRIVRAGRPFDVELHAGGHAAAGLRVHLRDQVPPGADAPDAGPWPWRPRIRYTATAREAGELRFGTVDFLLEDRRGLWRATVRHPCATRVPVLPPPEARAEGARMARSEEMDVTVADRLGMHLVDLEFESVHAFGAGDRLRDVDWRRLSQGRGVMAKQWARQTQADVLLLLDAGRTMRASQGATSKLEKAWEVALPLAELAHRRGHAVGAILFDESGVRAHQEARHGRDAMRNLEHIATRRPPRIEVRRRLDMAAPDEATPAGDEAFLEALGELVGARRHGGIRPALRRALGRAAGRRFLYLFTDLESLGRDAMAALGHAAREGAGLTVVVLPGSRYYDVPARPRLRDLEQAYQELEARRKARAWLRGRGADVLEVGPDDPAAGLVRRRGRPVVARGRP